MSTNRVKFYVIRVLSCFILFLCQLLLFSCDPLQYGGALQMLAILYTRHSPHCSILVLWNTVAIRLTVCPVFITITAQPCLSCQNDSGQNASPTAELFKHCWLCGQGLYSWQNKGSRLIFPAQVASSQTEGIKPSDYGRSHNLFSVFTVTLCHLLPPHPAHHNPIRSSPAFGIANLILPHPFIFHLVSLLPLNSHLHP